MNSSQKSDLIFSVYSDKRSVFTLIDIAMLIGETDFKRINERLNYYVGRGKLFRPRKGIYVKQGYNPEELACRLYTLVTYRLNMFFKRQELSSSMTGELLW
ncbi:hypothetical protein MASR2M69_08800 [Bacteroidota bacterium]